MDDEERDLGIKGGQGRTAAEVGDLTWFWFLFAVSVLVALLMLVGCARPSAYVELSVDASIEEMEAENTPDRPRWEELRQQFGGL